MNFNLKKLFRRKDILDDAEMAYVEGRATEAEAREVRNRFASSPGREAELESLRSTVNLLRSVEPARASRSFALAEAPAPVRAVSRRMAFAPAMAAIVAAIGVGVLTVGDLTGYVSQSDAGAADDFRTAASIEGDPVAEPNGPVSEDGFSALAWATGTPAASDPELAPPAGYGMTEDQWESYQATAAAGGQLERGAELDNAPEFSGSTVTGDSSDTADAPQNGDAAGAEADQRLATVVNEGEQSLVLPLWQLQLSLAGLTALFIAAWAYLRRRATA